MELSLTRPLLFFDIESTGLNIATDCIAELSFVKVFPDGEQRIKTWRFKPWDYATSRQYPIHPAASAVNGLKDEDLAGEPRFCDKIDEVIEWIGDSDLAGFNSAKFDLPMLAEEIERVRKWTGRKIDLDLHSRYMVDVQTIYHYFEPRNLKAAYRFYCGGEDFENAHTAEADTIATCEVLKGQIRLYGDKIKNDVPSLSSIGGRSKTVDYAGRLIIGEDGEPVISFGKHRGRTAREVYLSEPSYFAWIDAGEFTLDTKRQFALLKEKYDAEKKRADAEKQSRPASEEELRGLAGKWSGKLF